ncbi:hypothetical protein EV361DRAFT_954906 [Lentinula raphanica]|nr:hypothetical protein EV361DRAFT_954906 [Lentinula raphanica]
MLTGPEPEQVIENEENDRWSVFPRIQARTLYHGSLPPPTNPSGDDEDEEAHPIRIVTRTLYIRKRKSRERNLLHLSDHRSPVTEGVLLNPIPDPLFLPVQVIYIILLAPSLQPYPSPCSKMRHTRARNNNYNIHHFLGFHDNLLNFAADANAVSEGGTVCKGGILGVEKTKRREENGLSHEDEQNYHASFPPLDSDSDDDDKACDSEDNEEEGEGVAEDGGEGPLPVVTSSLRGGGGAGNPNVNAYTPTSGSVQASQR